MIRPLRLRMDEFRAFGVEWWDSQFVCDAVLMTGGQQPSGGGEVVASVTMQPLAPLRIEHAERWRMAGYRAMRPVVRAWRYLRGPA